MVLQHRIFPKRSAVRTSSRSTQGMPKTDTSDENDSPRRYIPRPCMLRTLDIRGHYLEELEAKVQMRMYTFASTMDTSPPPVSEEVEQNPESGQPSASERVVGGGLCAKNKSMISIRQTIFKRRTRFALLKIHGIHNKTKYCSKEEDSGILTDCGTKAVWGILGGLAHFLRVRFILVGNYKIGKLFFWFSFRKIRTMPF